MRKTFRVVVPVTVIEQAEHERGAAGAIVLGPTPQELVLLIEAVTPRDAMGILANRLAVLLECGSPPTRET